MIGRRERRGTGWFKVQSAIWGSTYHQTRQRFMSDGKKARALEHLLSLPNVVRIEIVYGGERADTGEAFFPPMTEATRKEMLEEELRDESVNG